MFQTQKKADKIIYNSLKSVGTELTNSLTLLGIELDMHHDWTIYCSSIVSKLSSIKFLIYVLKSILTRNQMVMVYFAQVVHRVRYGICVWENSSSFTEIRILQKRILRCILSNSLMASCRQYLKKQVICKIVVSPFVY